MQGKMAPDLNLPDQKGAMHRLKDYRGKTVLLYFYPKDDTPGCTVEAEGFRDNMNSFKRKGVVVLGISVDPVTSHEKFSKKFKLNFPILADPEKKVVEKYGVWIEKSMYGKKYMGTARRSFLIDKNGKVAKVYEKVKPDEHPEEVLKDIKDLKL